VWLCSILGLLLLSSCPILSKGTPCGCESGIVHSLSSCMFNACSCAVVLDVLVMFCSMFGDSHTCMYAAARTAMCTPGCRCLHICITRQWLRCLLQPRWQNACMFLPSHVCTCLSRYDRVVPQVAWYVVHATSVYMIVAPLGQARPALAPSMRCTCIVQLF
jgi:hypothetical protein